MLTTEEINKLIQVANEVEKNAFIFKSNHAFGAAVLTTDGEIFGGCNIDGIISSLGICAEMSALNNAVVNGKYNIKAVLVVDEDEFIYPCGTCLQYICQFYQTSDNDIEIIAAKRNGDYESKKLQDLLPKMYLSNSFAEKLKTFKNK